MTIKNNRVAICNSAASFCIGVVSPIAVYCSPRDHAPTLLLVVIAMSICSAIVDSFNSDNFHKNYKIAKAAGYSDGYLVFCFFNIIVVLTAAGQRAILDLPHYKDELWLPSWKDDLSLSTVLTAAALVAISDWFFYFSHRMLHERFPKVHLLHHCCVYSSLTTNLFFEPLDVLIEFVLPLTFLQFAAVHILDSSWTHIVATFILQTYYTLSHDEWLGLQHTRHHRYTSTGYFIYYPYFSHDPSKEQIRKLIPKVTQKDRNKGRDGASEH